MGGRDVDSSILEIKTQRLYLVGVAYLIGILLSFRSSRMVDLLDSKGNVTDNVVYIIVIQEPNVNNQLKRILDIGFRLFCHCYTP